VFVVSASLEEETSLVDKERVDVGSAQNEPAFMPHKQPLE